MTQTSHGMTMDLKALTLDGLVNAQATALVVDSEMFRPARELAERTNEELGVLVACPLCTGMWMALGQALIAELRQPPFNPYRFLRTALAVACVGRIVRRFTDVPL